MKYEVHILGADEKEMEGNGKEEIMPKALKMYLPCPYCGWYGPNIFKMVPKEGISNADPHNISQWELICTHCNRKIDQKEALEKFMKSSGKYRPL